MGVGSSGLHHAPLATLFGQNEEARRGPILGAAMLQDAEGRGWRIVLMAPLRLEVFDAHSAQLIATESDVEQTLRDHTPFTAFCISEDIASKTAPTASEAEGQEARARGRQIAVGCQDGSVLVFGTESGMVVAPALTLRSADGRALAVESAATEVRADASDAVEGNGASASAVSGGLALSVTAVQFYDQELYAGACGCVHCWDLCTGELRREFHLPGGSSGQQATPSALRVVRSNQGEAEKVQLWIGLDTGNIAIFDARTGVLVKSFVCVGPEAVFSIVSFNTEGVVFALSAHRRVSVWEASTCNFVQKYAAELITCGADLTVMHAAELPDMEASLLFLAGIDGSLCVRQVQRRNGKINCVLLCYLSCVSSHAGCPITSLAYHASTDSVLVGDAGCAVALVPKIRDQLCPAAIRPTAQAAVNDGGSTSVACSPSADTAATNEGVSLEPTSNSPQPQSYPSVAESAKQEGEEPVEHVVISVSDDNNGGDGANSSGPAFPVFTGS
mmetsp:Transcript_22046/g.61744  ORF Transcript_22046/g.61744 Transcript_22046/m.61744 type:complete len:503 (-) Transcript_22046:65-1573(-)